MECQHKYDTNDVWNYFVKAFQFLPLAARLNKSVLAIHGGLAPNWFDIRDLEQINRFNDPEIDSLASNILWGDPEDINGFKSSP